MTDEEAIELGARAVACKGWRWLPGMLTHRDDAAAVVTWRVLSEPVNDGHIMVMRVECLQRIYAKLASTPPPDLRDPATLGCLLALVREAKDDPGWQALNLGEDAWAIEGADYPTEAHALVAALEAAP